MAKTTHQDQAFEAEVICFKIKCGLSALDAVRTAMDEGPFSAETFTDALYCVWDYLVGRQKEMEELICKAIKGDIK